VELHVLHLTEPLPEGEALGLEIEAARPEVHETLRDRATRHTTRTNSRHGSARTR
jgi:hypothetical protein